MAYGGRAGEGSVYTALSRRRLCLLALSGVCPTTSWNTWRVCRSRARQPHGWNGLGQGRKSPIRRQQGSPCGAPPIRSEPLPGRGSPLLGNATPQWRPSQVPAAAAPRAADREPATSRGDTFRDQLRSPRYPSRHRSKDPRPWRPSARNPKPTQLPIARATRQWASSTGIPLRASRQGRLAGPATSGAAA
jgi:hypothetical protein